VTRPCGQLQSAALQHDDYRETIEHAGFEMEAWRENTEYRFVAERADNATQKYGVTSISLLARRTPSGNSRAVSSRSLDTAGRITVDQLLSEARRGLERLEPRAAAAAISTGALLVDIRSELQRKRDGLVPGALLVARNVLEWRCDPACPSCDERLADLDRQLILMCDEGYQSSLAAATLQRLGFRWATDMDGGFQAWRDAGLPVSPPD
jgi:rhodanese-related sulfurtransferase